MLLITNDKLETFENNKLIHIKYNFFTILGGVGEWVGDSGRTTESFHVKISKSV